MCDIIHSELEKDQAHCSPVASLRAEVRVGPGCEIVTGWPAGGEQIDGEKLLAGELHRC